MTSTIIWETPENREEYAETPCAARGRMWATGVTCGRLPREHTRGMPMPHAWRIYRDIPTAPPTTDAEPAPGDMTAPDTADTEGSGSAPSYPSDAGVRDQRASHPRTSESDRARSVDMLAGKHLSCSDAEENSCPEARLGRWARQGSEAQQGTPECDRQESGAREVGEEGGCAGGGEVMRALIGVGAYLVVLAVLLRWWWAMKRP